MNSLKLRVVILVLILLGVFAAACGSETNNPVEPPEPAPMVQGPVPGDIDIVMPQEGVPGAEEVQPQGLAILEFDEDGNAVRTKTLKDQNGYIVFSATGFITPGNILDVQGMGQYVLRMPSGYEEVLDDARQGTNLTTVFGAQHPVNHVVEVCGLIYIDLETGKPGGEFMATGDDCILSDDVEEMLDWVIHEDPPLGSDA